jgi:hypothetical protein
MIKNLFMKKIISNGPVLLLLIFIIISCKKNNLVVDQDVVPPAYAKFNVRTAADTAATYYVRNTNTPFKIPIGTTTVSDKDRTIQLCYTSTSAVAGAQYNAPATIVIPAGKVIDSLSIQGLFAGYPTSSRVDVLFIKICGGDVPASAYWATYKLTMRKYCDVVLANLAGSYTRTFEGTYGPYTSIVTNLVATSGTTATATITNIYDSDISANVTFDWTDPTAFKVIMLPQQTQYAVGGQPLFIRANPSTASSFSSCDNTITLNLQLYTSAGLVDQWTSSMAK